jgi:hypothetical protein
VSSSAFARNGRQYTLRGVRRLLLALALAAGAARLATAHDIPRDIVVHASVKPQGDRLQVMLRLPVEAIRDIPFPRLADGSLDVPRAEPLLRDGVVTWLLPGLEIREEGALLAPEITAVRVLPRDEFEVALTYPIRSDRSRFAIRPGFERLGLRVLTALVFTTPDGAVRAFSLRGDPGLVPLDPRWHQAVWRFIKIGFSHILDGADHLLFLVCLVIPFRRLRPLVLVVTAFTAAHSVALIAAAWNFVPDALWFPPLVETLIAASVFYMAIENIVSEDAPKQRMLMAFGFGLVHGFGFSFALKETMQFAGAHMLASLFAFNVGVEIGQVAVLLVLVPALGLLFRRVMKERIGTIVLSAIAAHIAWHWMADRWSALSQFPLPPADLQTLLFLVRAAIVLVVAAAAYRAIRAFRAREHQAAS